MDNPRNKSIYPSKKNKFYKKYLKTKSCYFHSKFKLHRDKLNHLLKLSKKNNITVIIFLKILKIVKKIGMVLNKLFTLSLQLATEPLKSL